MKRDISLYIHIPFCDSKCNYCAFVSKVATEEEKTIYVRNLIAEIKMRAKEYNQYFNVASVYIGGGTPSSLNNYAIRDILNCIYRSFNVKNNAEITLEANPNSLNKQKIREYILAGVNRFSVGLQSASEKVLKAMGRIHTVGDFDKVISDIRDQGISNINSDIIIGYPGQTLKDVQQAVSHLLELQIPHISCYMLQIEDNTKLKALVEKNEKFVVPEEKVIEMYDLVVKTLKANGYDRYEISNFAKPGFASYHNQVYWNRTDYLGFGVSAHSYVSGTRFSNTSNLAEYHRCITELGKPPVNAAKELTKEEKREESIMLSLRTSKGLDTKEYEKEFGEKLQVEKRDKIYSLIQNGFLVLSPDGILKCTNKGYLVLNKIISELV